MKISMKIIKTLISIILTLTIAVTVIPAQASAASKGKIYSFVPQVNAYYKEAEDYIASELRTYKTSIDVSAFNIAKEDVIYIYRSVMFDNPDIFYVDSAYIPYKFDNTTNTIAVISPHYIFKRSKLPSYVKKFNAAAKKMLSGVKSSWSDFQKALVIHDRIVAGCRYKTEGYKSYTAYNVIVSGKGICEGYSRAYCYLLSLAGVDSKCINNESEAHCWNMVKVGGKWYHVDVTSDDPTPDSAGYVRHKYFLISDSKLKSYKSENHTGYKSDITYASSYKCSSAKYSSSFFRNIDSQIVIYNKAYYYINNNYKGKHYSALIKRKGSSNKTIKVIKDVWRLKNGVRLNNSYCYLCQVNNYIFFNSKRKIFRYNLKTGKIKRMMVLPSVKTMNFIGIKSKGNYVYALRGNANLTKTSLSKMITVKSGKITVLPFLKYNSVSIKRKHTYNIKIYYGSGKTIYTSSNTKTAAVSSKGRIKAKKKGSCTITAAKNGIKLKTKVKVY